MRTIAEAIRIYENVLVLLDNGIFPGHYAPAITEARELIQSVIKDAPNEQEAAQPADRSDQSGEDAGRLAGG